ncbi:MAG: hypothetical protein DMG35_07225 [Acidobacteria bacterium]|nr:MAG: hypothetical protein DMG35_07225 [Acidobacteriota bacterium]
MRHHGRSAIAIVVTVGFLVISWFVSHQPADWEYVFFMLVVFSSALQDAMDGVNGRLEKITRLIEEYADKVEDLNLEVRQQAEYLTSELKQQSEFLKSHITAEANLVTYDIRLMAALQAGEPAPDPPAYPEPKLVEPKFLAPEPPKIEEFDAQKFRAEGLRQVADALRDHGWWDMSIVATPLRRLFAHVASRPAFIRWISKD